MANVWRWGFIAAAFTLTGCEPVTIPGIACGGAQYPNHWNLTIGGRSVALDYPCDKAAGTPVTFILNLHGTYPDAEGKFYMHEYFAGWRHVNTHNLIVATPRAVNSQWGNGIGGEQDLPHLKEVVAWVYANLHGPSKFDIRNMWIAGHSWGASYVANTAACLPEWNNDANGASDVNVNGVLLMSGGRTIPACSNRLSVLYTRGGTEGFQLPDQTAIASAHGCDGPRNYTITYERSPGVPGHDTVTEWPNCDGKWVHKNYVMLEKGHGFSPADWADSSMREDIVNSIVQTR